MSRNIVSNKSNFLFYTAPDGEVRVEVLCEDETVWLTQKRMAELFDVDVRTISEHLQNIFKTGELSQEGTLRKFRIVQMEGMREVEREIDFYNLDTIISVGYRVSSEKATTFRIWATRTLRGYIIKGYALNEDRLKNALPFGKDYFDGLLEKIRDIRASERRFYQKITDLYAQASIDYDKDSEITYTFYKTVQNKLHWAITGQTAAELIAERADHAKPYMGLMTWKNAPRGRILKPDVTIAKNYLDEKELTALNRFVSMYLDYAELQAERQRPMTMKDWSQKLDAFLGFNEFEILDNPGKVSHEVAKALAEKEFDEFRITQDREFVSDFDEMTEKYLKQEETSHS